MLKLYTCYCCGFPFKSDDQELPTECPACGANPDNFLVEPYNEQEIRRIHVDPPLPDPNRDPYNLCRRIFLRDPETDVCAVLFWNMINRSN